MSSSDWKLLPLEECMDAIIDYRGKTPRKSDFGIPLITAKIVKGGRILEPTEFIPFEDYDDRMVRGIPKPGDVVITTEAPLGEVGQLDNQKVSIGQRLITLRGKVGLLDNNFLKYLLMSDFVQNQLKARETGTTVSGIKQKELRKIKLPIPQILTQQIIAGILSSLDEKIELNRKTNTTLEAIAQAIFKEWFIDFNFPGATGEMIESELGLIPKGWRVGKLGEIVELRNERVQASLETINLPYVPIDLISPKSLFLQNFHTGDQAKTSLIKFYKEDIIFGAMRPYFHKVCIAPFAGTTRTTAFVLYPRNKIDYSFMTLIMHDPKSIEFATQNSTGSTIPYAKWNGSMANMLIIIPPEKIRSNFNEIIKPLLDSIHPKIFENNTLTSIRDFLLPKLMNGEIDL